MHHTQSTPAKGKHTQLTRQLRGGLGPRRPNRCPKRMQKRSRPHVQVPISPTGLHKLVKGRGFRTKMKATETGMKIRNLS